MHCEKHFASKKRVQVHVQQLHPKNSLAQGQNQVKPVTIVARLNKDLLCSFEDQNFDGHTDWIDEEDVDITGLSIPYESTQLNPSVLVIELSTIG